VQDRDEPGYWALFFVDPDGIRIEVAHWARETGAGSGNHGARWRISRARRYAA
jgi:hypothetical protein